MSEKEKERFGFFTRKLADHCRSCPVCSKSERKPDSYFAKIMAWHRSWCPAWAAYGRVHGERGSK